MGCTINCTNEDCRCLPEDFEDCVVIEGSVWGFILVMVLTAFIFGCVGYYVGKLHMRAQLFEVCVIGGTFQVEGYEPDFSCWRVN